MISKLIAICLFFSPMIYGFIKFMADVGLM